MWRSFLMGFLPFVAWGQLTWQTLAGETFPTKAWQREGEMICSIADGPWADLATKEKFRNFEWTFEWRLEAGTNSGVKYLVFRQRPNPQTGKLDPEVPKALGLELQLIDDERVPDAKVSPMRATGALYLYAAPPEPVRLTVGEWHRARVVVQGRKVEHWLDGKRVLAFDLEAASLRQAMAAEERADVPKPTDLDELKSNPAKAYPLVLTHHGGRACYRNMSIKPLR
jgi:hypothetical protein